jgi:hypothetical protein
LRERARGRTKKKRSADSLSPLSPLPHAHLKEAVLGRGRLPKLDAGPGVAVDGLCVCVCFFCEGSRWWSVRRGDPLLKAGVGAHPTPFHTHTCLEHAVLNDHAVRDGRWLGRVRWHGGGRHGEGRGGRALLFFCFGGDARAWRVGVMASPPPTFFSFFSFLHSFFYPRIPLPSLSPPMPPASPRPAWDVSPVLCF